MNTPNMTPAMEQALEKASQHLNATAETATDTNTATPPGAAAAENIQPPTTPTATETPAAVETQTQAQTQTPDATPTTPTTTEATPAPVTPAADSIFDLMESAVTPTTDTSTAAATKEAAEDYKAKYDELRSVLDDPEMVELINIKKSGGSLVDFAKQYTPVEYGKLSIDEITTQYGKSNGWTDEEIASEIEAVSSKSKFEQTQWRKGMQSELELAQQDKFKKLVADNSKQLADQSVIAERSMAKLDELSKKLPGRDMYNVMKLTDEHAVQFREFSANPPITEADGTINPNFMFAAYIGMKLMPDLHKSLQSTNQTLGRMDVLKDIARKTETNAAVVTTMPIDKSQETQKPGNPKELADEFFNRRSPN